MSDRTTVRDPFFDIVKFVAMFLVVVHHCVSRGVIACPPYVKNFTVGMNMPLFFILSGYFSRRMIATCDWRKLFAHLKGYLLPLAVLSFVTIAGSSVIKHRTIGEFLLASCNGFLFGAWYLWALSFMSLGVFLASMVARGRMGLTAFVSLIFYGALFVVDGVPYVADIRAMGPYYLAGVFFFSNCRIWEKRLPGLLSALGFLCVVFLEGNVYQNGLSWYDMPTSISVLVSSKSAIPLFIARLVLGFVGSVGVMWIVYCLVGRFAKLACLSQFGMETLGIYLLHERILNWGVGRLFPIKLWMLLPFAAFLFFGCHYLYKAIKPILTLSVLTSRCARQRHLEGK